MYLSYVICAERKNESEKTLEKRKEKKEVFTAGGVARTTIITVIEDNERRVDEKYEKG